MLLYCVYLYATLQYTNMCITAFYTLFLFSLFWVLLLFGSFSVSSTLKEADTFDSHHHVELMKWQ